MWDRTAKLTATQAARLLGVTPQLIRQWVDSEKLAAVDKRGRSPLYLWGDLVDVERITRLSRRSSRNEDRSSGRQLAAA